jgi:hypothetical protein
VPTSARCERGQLDALQRDRLPGEIDLASLQRCGLLQAHAGQRQRAHQGVHLVGTCGDQRGNVFVGPQEHWVAAIADHAAVELLAGQRLGVRLTPREAAAASAGRVAAAPAWRAPPSGRGPGTLLSSASATEVFYFLPIPRVLPYGGILFLNKLVSTDFRAGAFSFMLWSPDPRLQASESLVSAYSGAVAASWLTTAISSLKDSRTGLATHTTDQRGARAMHRACRQNVDQHIGESPVQLEDLGRLTVRSAPLPVRWPRCSRRNCSPGPAATACQPRAASWPGAAIPSWLPGSGAPGTTGSRAWAAARTERPLAWIPRDHFQHGRLGLSHGSAPGSHQVQGPRIAPSPEAARSPNFGFAAARR